MTAWKTVSPINTPTWSLERNPYSIWVDTDGNQLPYIDRIRMTLGENLEVINLRAIAGEYDSQARHIDISKLPVLLENQQKGDYRVHLDPSDQGADVGLFCNQSFDKDPEIAKWLSTPRIPDRAVARDRPHPDQRDVRARARSGRLGGAGRRTPYFPGPEYKTLHVGLRREEGQRDARRTRSHQEGQRGLPPARRRWWPAPTGADDISRLPAVHADGGDDRRAVEEDRRPRRGAGAGARAGHHAHASQRAPDLLRDAVGGGRHVRPPAAALPHGAHQARWDRSTAVWYCERRRGRARSRRRGCAS